MPPLGVIRAGDEVFHKPSGETWVVRRVVGDYLYWCGWPPGRASLSNCRLVYSVTDDEHAKWVERIAESEKRNPVMA